MSKASPGRFFEDFELGAVLPCPPPRQLDPSLATVYRALTGDRTAALSGAHSDTHPLIVFHTVISQTVRPVSLNAKANLGYAELICHRPVALGATVTTQVEVVGLRETSSGKTGIVWVRTTATDHQGPVLSYVRWVMVKKRDVGKATAFRDAAVVPVTADAVTADQLPAAKAPDPEGLTGDWFLEDYAVGETLNHPDGELITEADHMQFTRVFGNTARVHFDPQKTVDGRLLVFGGYPMSLGYAQALEGLDNRQGIIAINGGRHSTPVHAGDVIRSSSEVLDVAPQAEALRLMLRVVNQRDEPVLDLDYWERMPSRARLPEG